MNLTNYRYSRQADAEFAKTLRKNVNQYFKDNNISRTANANMVIKTITMLSLYFVPYALMLTGLVSNVWILLLFWVIMAFGMSGIGLSIMHDANHGSYSKNKTVNTILSYLLNFVGGNSINWRIQHNVLHHTYTNIEGADEDLDSPGILRFSPYKKRYKIHKYQYIYAWFFYSLLTLSWSTVKEFIQIIRFRKKGLMNDTKRYRWILAGLVFWKVFYFAYVLALPLWLVPAPVWVTIVGFFIMHMITGLILSVIFQLAHIMESCEFPDPAEGEEIKNNFIVHQLLNTTNFAPGNRLLSWFAGGLNYQVEHHLFPDVCHIHYRQISKVVQGTAEEFNIPYHTIPKFRTAILAHAHMLKKLGRA